MKASLILHHEEYKKKKKKKGVNVESRSIFRGRFRCPISNNKFDVGWMLVYNSRVTHCDPRIRVLS